MLKIKMLFFKSIPMHNNQKLPLVKKTLFLRDKQTEKQILTV
jgi:hypothetical protein